MQVNNHTPWSMEEIRTFKLLGHTTSKWRQREIDLYQAPDSDLHVVSVGVTFNRMMMVVAVETKKEWATALDYAAHGKVYVSE